MFYLRGKIKKKHKEAREKMAAPLFINLQRCLIKRIRLQLTVACLHVSLLTVSRLVCCLVNSSASDASICIINVDALHLCIIQLFDSLSHKSICRQDISEITSL